MNRVRILALFCILGVPAAALICGRDVLQTPDGMAYLSDVRDGIDLIHPHHPLFNPLILLAGRALQPLGAGPLLAAQCLGALMHALVLAAGWRFVRRLRPEGEALAFLALLASMWGFIQYSVRVEVYLTLAAASAWLCLLCTGEPGRSGMRRRALAVGALLASASLAHQMGALLAVPAAFTPWATRRGRWTTIPATGAAVLALYWVGFRWGRPTAAADGFTSWLLTYVRADAPGWGTLDNVDLAGLRALLGGLAAMVVPTPAQLLPLASIALGIAVFGLILTARREAGSGSGTLAFRFAWIWIVVQLLFSLWWLPLDTDFAFPALWPLWALGVLAAGRWRGSGLPVAVSAAALILMVIALGVALPRLERAGLEFRQRVAAWPAAEIPPREDYLLELGLRWYRGLEYTREAPAPGP